jgi:chemotaxis protein CheX
MSSDLFNAMLGMSFDPNPIENVDIVEDALQSSIHVSGNWNAEFRITVPQSLASQIACTMFDSQPDDLSSDEILDALGEVVNVIGGNAKGIINEECDLSLPCVGNAEAVQDKTGWLGLTFQCENQPVTIEILEKPIS